MVFKLCIACGHSVALRERSCKCGHVMLENLIVHQTHRLGANPFHVVSYKSKRDKEKEKTNSTKKRTTARQPLKDGDIIHRNSRSSNNNHNDNNEKINNNVEWRDFFLSKERELNETLRLAKEARIANQSANRTPRRPPMNKKRRGLLLLEERRRKIEQILNSPEHKIRMSAALEKINQRYGNQKRFLHFLKARAAQAATEGFKEQPIKSEIFKSLPIKSDIDKDLRVSPEVYDENGDSFYSKEYISPSQIFQNQRLRKEYLQRVPNLINLRPRTNACIVV